MEKLLRKVDIAKKTGIARTTLNGWIDDFRVFMPIVKRGQTDAFKPEVFDIIARIKELKEDNYFKEDILRILQQEGFPITVEEAVEDVENALKTQPSNDHRENLLNLLERNTKTVEMLAQQGNRINEHDEILDEHSETINTLTLQTGSQAEEISDIKKMLLEMKKEVAASQEQELLVMKKMSELESENQALKEKVNQNTLKKFFNGIFGSKSGS